MNAHYMWEELGFDVLEAQDGHAAISVLESRPDVAVLFSDCRMPAMSGPDLATLVAERWPHVRTVLTTGYYDVSVQGWQVLQKPYTVADLARTADDLLAAS